MSQISPRSFVRFLLVGGSATALQYVIMFALYPRLFDAGIASATGYCISTLYNYWANARFTFAGNHDHRRSLPRFMLTALTGLGINQLILLSCISLFAYLLTHSRLEALIPAQLLTLGAQLVATGCVLLWNYFINATWSFRSRHTS